MTSPALGQVQFLSEDVIDYRVSRVWEIPHLLLRYVAELGPVQKFLPGEHGSSCCGHLNHPLRRCDWILVCLRCP